jgi:hypothetical protein
LFLLLVFVMPEGVDTPWARAVEDWNPEVPFTIPVVFLRTMVGFYLLAMSFAEVWLIGAAFGLYVNTRTWIEGWDVEIAFRRIAQRLGRAAGILLLLAVLASPPPVAAQEADTEPPAPPAPEVVIREVKSAPEFEIHKARRRVLVDDGGLDFKLPAAGAWMHALANAFTILAVAAVVGAVAWLLWRFRHLFQRAPEDDGESAAKPRARVVMGMAVTPESLPPDLPESVWTLWQAGRHHEALALLYRGTIARLIDRASVEIHEADTEGDCLRRVEDAGPAAHPDYFKGLTRWWIRLAYAGQAPADEVVRGLCQDWPFKERGRA